VSAPATSIASDSGTLALVVVGCDSVAPDCTMRSRAWISRTSTLPEICSAPATLIGVVHEVAWPVSLPTIDTIEVLGTRIGSRLASFALPFTVTLSKRYTPCHRSPSTTVGSPDSAFASSVTVRSAIAPTRHVPLSAPTESLISTQ
jgi:hypothetical protein